MLCSLRARLHTTPFSTFAAVRNASTSMRGLANVLEEEAKNTPLADKGKDTTPAQETNRPQLEYKPFNSSFIRPHDLSLDGRQWKERPSTRPAQIAPSTADARQSDVFYQLGLDPLKFALHPGVLSPFLSEMGMIHPRRTTALTTKSQRRVAKAIRRAKMMGVIPMHSRFPRFQW
ncbi:hypothetical protein K438DRAFT_1826405 [Mycena galopus ATCC 62051]|nr:hypothetical protein K438DRAFT_1826405 [Mycena galopus ATCC 62051]